MRRFADVAVMLAAALIVLSAANPDHFPPWTSFHTEAPAFAAALLLLVAAAMNGGVRLGMPALLVAVLLTSAFVQWATGLVLYQGDAWVVAAYLLTFASAWLWAASARDQARSLAPLDVVIGVLLAMGVLTSFQGIVQWLQLEAHFQGWILHSPSPRSTGNFGQPNQSSTIILMGVAAGATLMVQRRIGAVAGWMWLVVAALAVVLTQSRTGLLSAAVMVAGFAALTFVRPNLRPFRVHLVAWLGLLLAFSWAMQALTWESTRGSVGVETMTSVGLRPVIWRQLLASLAAEPWSGYGWLQIGTAQQVGSAVFPGIEQANYAHNIVLDALVMLGVPLGLTVLGLCAFWIWRRLQRLPQDDGSATAALFMLMPFIVHCMLELPHAYSYMLVLGGCLFGVFAAATRTVPAAVPVPRWMVPALPAGFAVLLLALAAEYSLVEEDFRVNRFENRRLGQTAADYAPPRLRMLTQFNAMLAAMRLRAGRNMSEHDLETLVSASRRYTWAPLQYRAALALALNGRTSEAERHLRVIKSMFSAEIYEEGRASWILIRDEQYPELVNVTLP